MSKITINGVTTYSSNIPNIASVSFNYLGHKVYAAQKIQRIFGVFISQPIMGESGLVSWKEMEWSAQKFVGTDVYVYIRTSSTSSGLDSSSWIGPYLNSTSDISDSKGKFLQFMVVLANYGETSKNYQNIDVAVTPIFRSIELSYYTSSSAAKFYSTAFELGFVPKHILLTYNGAVTSDEIVRFAVSGFDSIDIDDYQHIDPNKIEDLSGLSLLSTKIKLMIEMIGSSSIPIIIHEIALMFSGDQQLVLNDMSTSSSSSSSTSYIENWSSSSSTEIRSTSSSSSSSSSSTEIRSTSSSSSSSTEVMSSSSKSSKSSSSKSSKSSSSKSSRSTSSSNSSSSSSP